MSIAQWNPKLLAIIQFATIDLFSFLIWVTGKPDTRKNEYRLTSDIYKAFCIMEMENHMRTMLEFLRNACGHETRINFTQKTAVSRYPTKTSLQHMLAAPGPRKIPRYLMNRWKINEGIEGSKIWSALEMKPCCSTIVSMLYTLLNALSFT